ncbi:MAG TPA: ribosome-associated translation inhibitor RaiA [Clostridiales bacterium]|nr:ribosome-associated translation inhibitor RaiA [Clostridiales bacterium]
MKFTFTERKVHRSNALREYAEKKVGKLERYFQVEPEANLVFSVEKERNKVELTIRSGGLVLRVSECTSDMYASVDAAVTAMERQLRKHKSRLEKRLRQDAFVRTVSEEDVSSFVPDVVENSQFQVERAKKFHLKPMTVDEAILQMELLGHAFFAFKNEDGGAFSVVYRRNNGGYGLIEDED